MEKELNIAAILKDKPVETKLWSPAIGECSFRSITMEGFIMVKADSVIDYWFSTDGKLYNEGECLLFPSKQMRDWSKFAWKKGDVLANTENDFFIIFDHFENDEYTSFCGKYAYDADDVEWYASVDSVKTEKFNKANDEVTKSHILDIEVHWKGKLNLSTLQIEKPKLEFKDGDIVFVKTKLDKDYIIAYKLNGEEKTAFYVAYNFSDKHFGYQGNKAICRDIDIDTIRLATDSEKQQLFDALAKEGKDWDAEKKMLVDLPKKCKFEPLDYVLVKAKKEEYALWHLYQFAFRCINSFCMVGNICFSKIDYNFLPYNDQTKHLLGTTDEWKGGEG